VIPPSFKQRALDDLGCGDGKITLLLKDIFQPRTLRGFDVNPALVRRARNHGIVAEVKDLNTGLPNGELAVMWGVIHHLESTETCLKRIRDNYRMAFIREPLKNGFVKGLEMGNPLVKEEIQGLVQQYLVNATTHIYGNCIFVFYDSSVVKTPQKGNGEAGSPVSLKKQRKS